MVAEIESARMRKWRADRLAVGGYRKREQAYSRPADDVELYHQVMSNLEGLAPAEMCEMVRLSLAHLNDQAMKSMVWRARVFLGLLNREAHVRHGTDIPGQGTLKEC